MGEDICPLSGWSQNLSDKAVWELLLVEEEQEAVYKIPTFILLCFLMLVGLPGNVLVLLVYGFRFPASTTKSFIMAMAVFDLINCVMGMPFEMVDLRYDVELNIPVACKVIRFGISLSACGSVTVLVAVSIDRFRRICRAFHKQMSVRQSRILIGVLTLLSVTFALPALILYGRQTEIRFNQQLHDCSIDDLYKDGKLAAVYQYILGGTWVVSIAILVIMYSFIIYKINLQKKRREKLSNQSCESAVFTRLKRLSMESHPPDIHRSITRSSNEHSSFVVSCGKNLINNDRSRSIDVDGSQSDGDESREGRGSRLMNRLFSRDVNPIFEDFEENCDNDNAQFCDSDEDLCLSNPSREARLINFGKTSLNNYLAASQETDLTQRSTSLVQSDTTDDGSRTFEEDSEIRARLGGQPFGRYHSWESEELMHKVKVNSSDLGSGLSSHSEHVLDEAGATAHDCVCELKRASSNCSLQRIGQKQSDGHICLLEETNCAASNKCCNNIRTSVDLQSSTDKPHDNNCSNVHPKNIITCPVPESDHSCIAQGYSDLHSINKSQIVETNIPPNSTSISVPKFPTNKFKSGSIDVTLTQSKKKKFATREIKTSKVSLMMLMVTAGFVLSYLPHLGIQFFKSLYPSLVARLLCTNQAYFVVHHFLMRFFFINNAINPIIYSFYNKTFRERCLRLLKSPRSLIHTSEHYISNARSISQDNDTS